MEKQGQAGVYQLFKLSRIEGNRFDPEQKRLERDSHVVTHDYAETVNKNSVINGVMYVEQPEKTKLYHDKKPFKTVKEFAKFEEVDEEKEALVKEYTELKGNAPNKLWGTKKLTEEIQKLKDE